jgi:hypothetical protein
VTENAPIPDSETARKILSVVLRRTWESQNLSETRGVVLSMISLGLDWKAIYKEQVALYRRAQERWKVEFGRDLPEPPDIEVVGPES